MKKLFVLIIFLLSLGIAKAATPNLFFLKSDIPSLKAKVDTPKFKEKWQAYVVKANELCDPNSKSYADPNKVTKGFENLDLRDPDDRPAYYGWRLRDQMQNLGLVYYLTGEQKYREHGVKLLMSYVREFPAEKMVKSKYAGTIGNMMLGFATGYDMFGEFLTDQERDTVLQSSKLLVENFLTTAEKFNTLWRPYHNYCGVCGGDAGILAIQLADMDKQLSQAYIARIVYLAKDWLWRGFDEEGAYFEGVSYATYGLENTIIFIDALKRSGGENLFEHPTLKKLVNWYALSLLPGEKIMDARNDATYDNPGDILLKLASEHKNGLDMWMYPPNNDGSLFLEIIWSSDIKPVSPVEAKIPLAQYFRQRGLCIWRSGWDTNDIMFSIESGQFYPITHNQADKGHFTLYGFGYRWACDPGYGCNQDPEGRCQTVAHNCIMIDGKGQSISGAGMGNNGKILAYDNNETYGYALADNTEAYRQNIDLGENERIYHYGGKPVHNMDIDHALRHTFYFQKTSRNPAYAVILDDVAKDKAEHEYCWQMLSWPDLKINIADQNMAVISPKDVNDANKAKMFVFIDSNAPISLREEDYVVTPNDHRKPSAYTRLRAYSKAVNPYFAAVLIPTNGDVNSPKINFENSLDKKEINIKWPNRTDKILWKKDGTSRPQLIILNK